MRSEGLQAFAAAARHGSFTAGAAGLGISQSSMSRRIAAVEREVGTPLFVRGPDRATLTPAGLAFARAVPEVLSALEAARIGGDRSTC